MQLSFHYILVHLLNEDSILVEGIIEYRRGLLQCGEGVGATSFGGEVWIKRRGAHVRNVAELQDPVEVDDFCRVVLCDGRFEIMHVP